MAEPKTPKARLARSLRDAHVAALDLKTELIEAAGIAEDNDLGKVSEIRECASLVERAEQKIRRLLPTSASACLGLDSPVLTPGGWRAISDIRVGQLVVGWDTRRGSAIVERVVKVAVHEDIPTWDLFLGGVRTSATRWDPLWTGLAWTRVGAMKEGTNVPIVQRGVLVPCEIAEARPTGRRNAVATIVTTAPHTFIVNGMVAHSFAFARVIRTALMKTWPSSANAGHRPVAGLS